MSSPEEIRDRTKKFAIRIVRLFRALPKTTEAQVMGKQLLRCGTSVAANYRAVCRALNSRICRTHLGSLPKKLMRVCFWLELLADTETLSVEKLRDITREARELAAIFSASQKTAKGNR